MRRITNARLASFFDLKIEQIMGHYKMDLKTISGMPHVVANILAFYGLYNKTSEHVTKNILGHRYDAGEIDYEMVMAASIYFNYHVHYSTKYGIGGTNEVDLLRVNFSAPIHYVRGIDPKYYNLVTSLSVKFLDNTSPTYLNLFPNLAHLKIQYGSVSHIPPSVTKLTISAAGLHHFALITTGCLGPNPFPDTVKYLKVVGANNPIYWDDAIITGNDIVEGELKPSSVFVAERGAHKKILRRFERPNIISVKRLCGDGSFIPEITKTKIDFSRVKSATITNIKYNKNAQQVLYLPRDCTRIKTLSLGKCRKIVIHPNAVKENGTIFPRLLELSTSCASVYKTIEAAGAAGLISLYITEERQLKALNLINAPPLTMLNIKPHHCRSV